MALGGAVRRDGERGRMARPFVVVHSGRTTMAREGLRDMRAERVVRGVPLAEGGWRRGGRRAPRMAREREMCCRSGVVEYEVVKIGSKIAAR